MRVHCASASAGNRLTLCAEAGRDAAAMARPNRPHRAKAMRPGEKMPPRAGLRTLQFVIGSSRTMAGRLPASGRLQSGFVALQTGNASFDW